jgi:hypothetical protein
MMLNPDAEVREAGGADGKTAAVEVENRPAR